MPITKLTVFSENGDKNTTGLNQNLGFPSLLKPARQWFNYLFNAVTKKINEVIDGVDFLQDQITIEKADRIYSDNLLNDKIDYEITQRENADYGLQQQIDDLQQQIYSANTRIALLEAHELYRVGDLFISTTLFANAGDVHAHIGYGTWERFGDGHALVAAAFLNEGGAPAFMLTPGATGGEYSHVLTIDEMPAHSHTLGDSAGTSGTGRTPDLNSSPPDTMNITDAIGMTGGGMAHNNIQPSITVCVWKRIS
ncbi:MULTISPECIES: hypothetical protein [unclassified Acinetobacter]|uniref:phage baseplate protein n=1 Tax=unclassified Acinetobacter TaxID=196816 RepID=UPI00244B94E8|nr:MULTISPECIES: hypothetical protein [unclassified Acinetobacter]MDH0030303.1 hypothetical protein [Acinetobacter sp. GD04021]MDH0885871.1 hypothetical protein [Acinetobacter sp. GD03873]MDH1082491.1 hypothetical protein [Acinetobacter sp. GD03983]MDH2189117.1 hypothetical protein [Acinetobacter sp. GD03645]MDH2202305.1 hypothetical protein [Acinetobacter sp. GD03647]